MIVTLIHMLRAIEVSKHSNSGEDRLGHKMMHQLHEEVGDAGQGTGGTMQSSLRSKDISPSHPGKTIMLLGTARAGGLREERNQLQYLLLGRSAILEKCPSQLFSRISLQRRAGCRIAAH